MGVPSSSPPPVGTIGVGELLADAQTKALWLGVAASIDPAQSVLIGDIVGLMADDDQTLVDAKAYTDTKAATKANTVHTHAIADVTGLTAALALASSSLPTGCIVLWSGSLGAIPGGWHLCDGTSGTPDLRDRFVMCAGGTYSALQVGGSLNRTATSSLAGAHTPAGAVQDTVLNITQLPSHIHVLNDPGHNHAISDPGHYHYLPVGNTGNNAQTMYGSTNNLGNYNTSSAITGITIQSRLTGATIGPTGSNAAHTHGLSLNAVADHQHTVSFDVLPPYIALGYIMKV